MFESDADTAEIEQTKRFQWVVPFLGGLLFALLVAGGLIASYLLKMGPFAGNSRQSSIESAVTGATDEIRRQIDEAAFNEDATADPAFASEQAISIGALSFGPGSVQAVGELASAEARGLVKCEPALAGLDPSDRAALPQISCALTPAKAPSAPPGQPAQATPTIALTFAGGRIAILTYSIGGVPAPERAGDMPPSAPPEAPSQAQNTPNFTAPPPAPALVEAPPAPAADAPPPQ